MAVLPALLLAGCLLGVARADKYGFGISVTQTDIVSGPSRTPWVGPPNPVSVVNALKYLVNQVDNDGLVAASTLRRIQLEPVMPPNATGDYVPDDMNSVDEVRRIYAWYATRPEVMLLLCPSRVEFLKAAVEAGGSADAIWICWALEQPLYNEPLEGSTVPVGSLLIGASLMASKMQLESWNGFKALEENLPLSLELKFQGFKPQYWDSWETQELKTSPSDEEITQILSRVRGFDINLPAGRRWSNILARARVSSQLSGSGSVTVVALYELDWKDQAEEMALTATRLGYSQVDLVAVTDFTLYQLSELLSHIEEVSPNLLFLMMGVERTTLLLLNLYTRALDHDLVAVTEYPMVHQSALHGFLLKDIVLPSVWPGPQQSDLFGSFQLFGQTYQRDYFSDSEMDHILPMPAWRDLLIEFNADPPPPPLPVMQVAAAGELFVMALRAVPSITPETMANYIREHRIRTIYGTTVFDSHGRRENPTPDCDQAMTRQFLPFEDLGKATDFLDVGLTTVSGKPEPAGKEDPLPVGASTTTTNAPRASVEHLAEINFPMPTWHEKTLELYPCPPGCFWHKLSCHDCNPGRYRTTGMSECQPCEEKRFAHSNGSQGCLACPMGATCDSGEDKGITPMALKGWYSLELLEDTKAATHTLHYAATCPTPKYQRKTFWLSQCPSASACAEQGNKCKVGNTGFACAQCEEGYAFTAPFPGLRRCTRCGAFFWSAGTVCVVAACIALFTLFWQTLADKAASNRSSSSCVILKILVSNTQLISCVLAATSMDSDIITSVVFSYGNILLRPLESMRFVCIVGHNGTFGIDKRDGHTRDTVLVSLMLIPFGFALCVTIWTICIIVFNFVSVAKITQERITDASRPFEVDDESGLNEEHMEDDEEVVEAASAAASSESSSSISDERASDGREGKKNNAGLASIQNFFQAGADFVSAGAEQFQDKLESQVLGTLRTMHPKSNWSPFYGPGFRYRYLHVGFLYHRQFLHWSRCCIVTVLLLFAPTLRGISRGFACQSINPFGAVQDFDDNQNEAFKPQFSRLEAHFETDCHDVRNVDFRSGCKVLWVFVALGVPVSLYLLLLCCKRDLYTIPVRRALGVLTVGYKQEYWWWEIVRMFRAVTMYGVCYFDNVVLQRIFGCVVLSLVFLVLHVFCRPCTCEHRGIVHHLELLGMLGIFITLLMAYIKTEFGVVPAYRSFVVYLGFEEDSHLPLVLPVAIFHTAYMAYGVLGIVLSEMILELKIMQDAGWALGSKTGRFLKFSRLIYGLNSVVVVNDSADQLHLDIRGLSKSERHYFTQCIKILIHACVKTKSGTRFYPTMLVHGIREAFRRATTARTSYLHWRCFQFGSGIRPVKDFRIPGLPGFGSVAQVPPDLIAIKQRDAFTIDELGVIFADVAHDIENSDPTFFHCLREVRSQHEEEKLQYEVKEWTHHESIAAFMQDLAAADRCWLEGERTQKCPKLYMHIFMRMPLEAPVAWECARCRTVQAGDSSTDSDLQVQPQKCRICGYKICDACKQLIDTELTTQGERGRWWRDYSAAMLKDEFMRTQKMSLKELDDAIKRAEEDTLALRRTWKDYEGARHQRFGGDLAGRSPKQNDNAERVSAVRSLPF